MSRIAKLPVIIPAEMSIFLNSDTVGLKYKDQSIILAIPTGISVLYENNAITVDYPVKKSSFAGSFCANLRNCITGLTAGFERKLSLSGVGYRAQIEENKLILSIGFSQKRAVMIPDDLSITTIKLTLISIKGISLQRVTQMASKIRELKKPEPYHGFGIRYVDEKITLKEIKKK